MMSETFSIQQIVQMGWVGPEGYECWKREETRRGKTYLIPNVNKVNFPQVVRRINCISMLLAVGFRHNDVPDSCTFCHALEMAASSSSLCLAINRNIISLFESGRSELHSNTTHESSIDQQKISKQSLFRADDLFSNRGHNTGEEHHSQRTSSHFGVVDFTQRFHTLPSKLL